VNPTSVIGSAVVAALISGFVSIIGIWISTRTTRGIHAEKLTFDQEQARRKTDADIALAEKKLALDRAFAAWKRKTEFAETVLADFYQVKDIISGIRSPGSFGNEGQSRPREPWETESDTRKLNNYFIVIERLEKKSEFFSQFIARRYQFIAMFGPEAAKPYDDLWKVRADIIISVRMLLQTHQRRDLGSIPEDRKAWETTMGWLHAAQDPIDMRINQIIDVVELICRPVIQDVAP